MVNFQVSNHGPVCSCPDGYQGDPLSQCFRSRRGWIRIIWKWKVLRALKSIKHIRSLENIRRARTCFRWTFRYLLKTIALPKSTCNRETSVWFHQPFNSFTRKIVLRRHHRLDWSIYLQLHSLSIAKRNIFPHLSRVKIYQRNNQRMHKYIRDEKLNCPRAYLPGAVLGWK